MKKLALGALCLAGFLAACGGYDGTVSPTIDAHAAIDAPIVVAACDPLAAAGQQGCNTGQKCTWITITDTPDTIGKIGCVPDGTIDLAGACTEGAAGETTGYDNCKAGNICVAQVCKDICGYGGGANEACAAGQACTRYSGLWANGMDDPMYGACNPTCNPVTQLRGDGTSCGANQGCYLLVSQTTSTAVCAGAGMVTAGTAIVGTTFANSCVPGAQPRAATQGTAGNECGGLCDVKDVFITNPADAGGTNTRPTVPADTTKVTNFAAEGGAAPYNCATKWGAAAPNDAAAGESCRYWWAKEPFDNLSPFSNTVGWCFKHATWQFDSDNNMAVDSPFPRCAALTKQDKVLPIANPAGDDALYFFCEAMPAMLQTSIKNVKKSVAGNALLVDRLGGWR